FEAIVDPQKMSGYFIAYGSGRMETGKTLTWKFPEFDMEFPIKVKKVDAPSYISFFWDDIDGKEMQIEITLKTMENDSTFVSVTEKSRDNDEKGIDWLKRNTEGWANFLACLKAYVEYGINLRKGAFDISQMPEFQNKD
ncbi:MAG TPA: SRPBCC domain-containing protein, partial [Chitinophagaceae bacterium]|nr:SRPBCC domain-containing protein [Chitinophagaceae bacterium]